ncbi:hypothetical protein CBR_g17097 [Chara braunii]|uniref:UBC core domain-containing protein n=1 Tax=Chara braunii TaxID=69332 RepID=A0A388KUM8_CHABU|nr:hypothetical protein CBR_g17097 [Chara braunii]|eukprot:GBG73757.1 hypothetical protein CBR_g17097 [Chara braunii]
MERRQGRRGGRGGGGGGAGEGSGGGGGGGGGGEGGGGKGGAVRSKASWSSCFCCLDNGEWEKRKKKRDTRSRRRRSRRRYDREVSDLGSLLYKASMSNSGRTASSGSSSDVRSRAQKGELGRSGSRGSGRRRDARLAGGWDSRSLHAVKQLHETLRDMPVGERDRLLREDLLLLSPIINELCPKLPETHYTFVLPYADDVDVSANRYVGGLLDSIKRRQKPPRWPVQSAHSGNNQDKASDPFRVPSEYRRILARKNNGIILEPPRFVRRLVEKPLPKDYAQYAIAQPKMTMVATSMLRIMCELRLLKLNPLPGISAGPVEEDNLYKWRAVFEGPAGTPWAGGRYILDIEIPEGYPRKPPSQLRFISRMFHPNIDPRGVPCIDLMESHAGTRGDAQDGSLWRSSSATVHSDETPLSLSTAASSPAASTPFRETGTSIGEREGQLSAFDIRGQGAGTRRESAALSQRGDDSDHHQQNLSSASGASGTVTPKASAADARGEFLQPGTSDLANLPTCHSAATQESSHMFVSSAHDSTPGLSPHSGGRGASCLPLPLLPPPAERHSRRKEVPTVMGSIGTVSDRGMLQAAATEAEEDTWDVDSSHASPTSQSPLQTPSFTPCSSPPESLFRHRDCEGSMTPDHAWVSASGPNASSSTLEETMAVRFMDGGGLATVPKMASTAPLMQPEVLTTSWVVGRGGARQVGQVNFKTCALGVVPTTHIVQIMKSRAGLSSTVQMPSATNRKPESIKSDVGKAHAAAGRERAPTGRGGESRVAKLVKENGSSARSRDWMAGQGQLCPGPEFAKQGPASQQKQQATSVDGRCRDVDISSGPNHALLRGGELAHRTAVSSPLLPMQREPSSQANLRIPLVRNGELDESNGRAEDRHPLPSPLRSSVSPLMAARAAQPSVQASDVAASVNSLDNASTDRADVAADNIRLTPCPSGRLSTDSVSLANAAADAHREWTGCCSLTSILVSVQMLFWEATPENAVNTAAASVYQNSQLEWAGIVRQCAAESLRVRESGHSLGVSCGDPLL